MEFKHNDIRSKFFENKLKPALLYIGTIGAILMMVAYVVVVIVLIFGFKVKSLTQSAIFAGVNAVIGFIIMQFLKVQGLDFAKSLPENIEISGKYFMNKTKDKKAHSLKYFWSTTIIKDLLSKALLMGLTTTGLIYIVIEGTQDYSLLLLAAVNLIMFICFGLLSLVSAYDYYNTVFVPYMQEQLKEINLNKEIENVRNTEEQSDNSIKEPSRASSEE